MMIIYKTTNRLNGKIYVGQDTMNRPRYYGSGKYLRSAIRKYGKESFIKEVLEACPTLKVLDAREDYWINELKSRNPKFGYNIARGGRGHGMLGRKHSKELCERFSKRMIENNPVKSREVRDRIANTLLGNIPWNKGKKYHNKKTKMEEQI